MDAFVVDDEEGICRFVAMTLEGLGLAAASYANVQDAIAALERGHPDMIFLDLALEGSDAVEMLRLLGEKRYSGVIQLMSGSRSGLLDDVRRIGARHGLQMREPLEKPFRAEAVRRVVMSAQREMPREATFTLTPAVKSASTRPSTRVGSSSGISPRSTCTAGRSWEPKVSSGAAIPIMGCSRPVRSCPGRARKVCSRSPTMSC